jgi:hypothetical protein
VTFDHRRSLRNLPLALAICFGIDAVHAAIYGLPMLDIVGAGSIATNLGVAAAIAALSGLTFKGRRT